MIRSRTLAVLALTALVAPLSAQRPVPTSLDTVRVASRASSAASVTRAVEVVSRDDIERRAARSLAELLSFALGADVQTRSPAQADLSLRGSTFNQVVVLVDGVRVSDVQSGHYALDLAVPLGTIERIEILRGTGSALYGSDAIGGVVNIVTRSDISGGALSARGGSFGGAAAGGALFSALGGTGIRVAGDLDRSDGHRPGTDHHIRQLRISLERATRAGRLVADVGEGLRDFGAADFYAPYPSEETTRSTTAAIRLLAPPDARAGVDASVHLRRHGDVFTLKRDDPGFYRNEHTSDERGGELVARAAFAPGVSGAVGASLLDARLRSARLGDHAQSRAATFAQLTLGGGARPTLDIGVRGDRISGQRDFLSPSVGVSAPLGAGLRLRGALGRGFRAPTWTERFYVDPANVADSTLAPERFWSGEVGLRGMVWGGALADLTVYERRATDLIDWARPADAAAGTPWRTRNFATATHRGVEASLRLPTLLGADWTLSGSGLRFESLAAAGLAGKYALRPLTRTLGVAARRPIGERGMVTVDARRSRRAGERDGLMVNSRLTLPVRGLLASVELVNLADADFADGAGKPVAGRSAYAGLSWSWR